MHVSSLGEFEQGRPLIEKWKKENPDDRILLSFFSPSGFSIRKDYPLADSVFYLPLDTRKNMNRLIRHINPDLFILVKYDFWPNLLNCLDQHGVPVYLVSARFRETQYLFKWWGASFLNQIRRFKHIFVQDEPSQQLLYRYGVTQVTVAGDTRVDAVVSRVTHHASRITYHVLIAGSTWPAEEKMLAEVWFSPELKDILANWKLIIAPHDIRESHLKEIELRYGGGVVRDGAGMVRNSRGVVRYSEVKDFEAGEWKIILLDSIGQLAGLYRYGNLAVIGGGFGKGIHNILEPSAYGLPVAFGPEWQKFREAHDLIRVGSAFSFQTTEELAAWIKNFASDADYRAATGKLALKYMESQAGSTDLIISYLMEKNLTTPVDKWI
jgi:3-deoxy-D-manno-octulosonic-acid transferase